ncbi:hypothetical protein [Mucilaginibacter xinganensis]|uniref:BioF2-like acetyltransferase domain-containing protein n=1 Tax=Mucilaginibacter xinganensis TaxID=1234841 RepID=A0A223NXZ0_9SPHI|nr:hypothetical protein [Mucilaginibacter xinganensis]ASU34749.1 hypothetical protein MuYL_2862 [Mucilaginibacter xinganensis]
MLQIKISGFGGIPCKIIWFASRPKIWDCINGYYKQSTCSVPVIGYRRELFFTKIIDLNSTTADLEAGFDQKTAYEIRRAVKDGIATEQETDLKYFEKFYNLFAQSKQLPQLSRNFINYEANIVITKAIYNQEDIVMHAYLTDAALKRTRLLYSASLFRTETDTQIRAIAGRANRLLHYKDMCYFKNLGFGTYDLGGYAQGTNDESLLKINQFKDSFGGNLKQETDYYPVTAVIISAINKIFKV